MPSKLKSPCNWPGCPKLCEAGESYCEEHRKANHKDQDRRRGTAAERGYGARWQRARRVYLRRHPLCVQCLSEGRTVAAQVVDHIEPHRGDTGKFWDRENWQSLCIRHHNAKTARGR